MYSSLCIEYRAIEIPTSQAGQKFRGRVTAIYTTFPYIKYIKNLALNLALNLAVRIKKTCGILVAQEVVPRY